MVVTVLGAALSTRGRSIAVNRRIVVESIICAADVGRSGGRSSGWGAAARDGATSLVLDSGAAGAGRAASRFFAPGAGFESVGHAHGVVVGLGFGDLIDDELL